MYREALGDDHPKVTSTVDEIAALYVIVGDYAKAAAILEEVVKLKAATLGVDHTEVASTLLDLANAYEEGEDHTKAMKSLKKAYSIYVSSFGGTSREATDTLERVAQSYRSKAETERAVTALLTVLRGRKALYGESDPMIARTYYHLGGALRENDQLDKAMKCLKHALSIYVGEGKDMHDVGMIAQVMREMAQIHTKNGQHQEASKILKQELAIRKKMGNDEAKQVARTLYYIGLTELEMRNSTKALNILMEGISIYESPDGELGIDFAETLYATGTVFVAMRHHERAQEAFSEALRVYKLKGLTDSDGRVKAVTTRLETIRKGTHDRTGSGDRHKVTVSNGGNSRSNSNRIPQ